MRTTKALRALQRKYLKDLLRRTLKAPCPRCKAKSAEPCTRHGKPLAGRHWQRADEARRLGHVSGKRCGSYLEP